MRGSSLTNHSCGVSSPGQDNRNSITMVSLLGVRAGQVWVMFVTEQEGDQEFLMAKQRELRWRYKPTISCFNGDPSAPLQHPKGDPSTLSRSLPLLTVHVLSCCPTKDILHMVT